MTEIQTPEGSLSISPLHVVAIRPPKKKPAKPAGIYLDGLGWVDVAEKYSSLVEKVEDEINGFERVDRKKA